MNVKVPLNPPAAEKRPAREVHHGFERVTITPGFGSKTGRR